MLRACVTRAPTSSLQFGCTHSDGKGASMALDGLLEASGSVTRQPPIKNNLSHRAQLHHKARYLSL